MSTLEVKRLRGVHSETTKNTHSTDGCVRHRAVTQETHSRGDGSPSGITRFPPRVGARTITKGGKSLDESEREKFREKERSKERSKERRRDRSSKLSPSPGAEDRVFDFGDAQLNELANEYYSWYRSEASRSTDKLVAKRRDRERTFRVAIKRSGFPHPVTQQMMDLNMAAVEALFERQGYDERFFRTFYESSPDIPGRLNEFVKLYVKGYPLVTANKFRRIASAQDPVIFEIAITKFAADTRNVAQGVRYIRKWEIQELSKSPSPACRIAQVYCANVKRLLVRKEGFEEVMNSLRTYFTASTARISAQAGEGFMSGMIDSLKKVLSEAWETFKKKVASLCGIVLANLNISVQTVWIAIMACVFIWVVTTKLFTDRPVLRKVILGVLVVITFGMSITGYLYAGKVHKTLHSHIADAKWRIGYPDGTIRYAKNDFFSQMVRKYCSAKYPGDELYSEDDIQMVEQIVSNKMETDHRERMRDDYFEKVSKENPWKEGEPDPNCEPKPSSYYRRTLDENEEDSDNYSECDNEQNMDLDCDTVRPEGEDDPWLSVKEAMARGTSYLVFGKDLSSTAKICSQMNAMFTCKDNVIKFIEACYKWIRKFVDKCAEMITGRPYTAVGRLMRDFDQIIAQQKTYFAEFEKIPASNFAQRMGSDIKTCQEFVTNYNRLNELRLDMLKCDLPSHYASEVGKIMSKMSNHYSLVVDLIKTARARPEPACVYLFGKPGHGKTRLMRYLAAAVYRTTTGQAWTENQLYERKQEQEFWDGYRNQWVTTIDDVFQIKDPAERAISSMEIINMVNSNAYPLYMANLDQKDTTHFTSSLLLLSTNDSSLPRDLGITDKAAVYRRLHFRVRVEARPEFIKLVQQGSDIVEKVEFPEEMKWTARTLNNWNLFLVDEAGNETEITFADLVDMVRNRIKRNEASAQSQDQSLNDIDFLNLPRMLGPFANVPKKNQNNNNNRPNSGSSSTNNNNRPNGNDNNRPNNNGKLPENEGLLGRAKGSSDKNSCPDGAITHKTIKKTPLAESASKPKLKKRKSWVPKVRKEGSFFSSYSRNVYQQQLLLASRALSMQDFPVDDRGNPKLLELFPDGNDTMLVPGANNFGTFTIARVRRIWNFVRTAQLAAIARVPRPAHWTLNHFRAIAIKMGESIVHLPRIITRMGFINMAFSSLTYQERADVLEVLYPNDNRNTRRLTIMEYLKWETHGDPSYETSPLMPDEFRSHFSFYNPTERRFLEEYEAKRMKVPRGLMESEQAFFRWRAAHNALDEVGVMLTAVGFALGITFIYLVLVALITSFVGWMRPTEVEKQSVAVGPRAQRQQRKRIEHALRLNNPRRLKGRQPKLTSRRKGHKSRIDNARSRTYRQADEFDEEVYDDDSYSSDEDVIPEGDENATELAYKLARNVRHFTVSFGPRARSSFMTFVKGKIAVTSLHVVEPPEGAKIEYITLSSGPQKSEQGMSVHTPDQFRIWKDPKRDLAIIAFDHCREHSNLVGHLREIPIQDRLEGPGRIIIDERNHLFVEKGTYVEPGKMKMDDQNIEGYWARNCAGVVGHCGLPYVIFNQAQNKKFLGIHTASNGNHSVICPVFRKDIELFEANYAKTLNVSLGDPVQPNGFEIEMDREMPRWIPGTAPYCTLKKHRFHNAKSKIKPTFLQSEVRGFENGNPVIYKPPYPILEKPSRLRPFMNDMGVIIDPLHKALDQFGEKYTMAMPKGILDLKYFEGLKHPDWDNVSLRPYTLEEAVHGTGDPDFAGLPTDSSGGPYFSEKGLQSKDLFTHEPRWIHPELKKKVEDEIELVRKGVIPPYVVSATLKSERRSIKRVEAGETRIFANGEKSHLIRCRMFLGSIYLRLVKNKGTSEFGVGLNPHGMSWKVLYDRIKHYKRFICDDVKAWDQHMPLYLRDICSWWFHKEFDISPDSDWGRQIYAVITSLFQAIWLCEDYSFVAEWMPSGTWLTAMLNTIWNSVSNRYIFYLLVPPGEKFEDHVEASYHGDDTLQAISDYISQWYNGVTRAKVGHSLFGWKVTPWNKEGEVKSYCTLDDVTYLKRRFVPYPGGLAVYCPLEMKSIMMMTYWVEEGKDVDFQKQSFLNCHTALREWFYHGKYIFDQQKKILNDRIKCVDPRFIFTDSWESMLEAWLHNYPNG